MEAGKIQFYPHYIMREFMKLLTLVLHSDVRKQLTSIIGARLAVNLETSCDKLISLLSDPQPGLFTWKDFFRDEMLKFKEISDCYFSQRKKHEAASLLHKSMLTLKVFIAQAFPKAVEVSVYPDLVKPLNFLRKLLNSPTIKAQADMQLGQGGGEKLAATADDLLSFLANPPAVMNDDWENGLESRMRNIQIQIERFSVVSLVIRPKTGINIALMPFKAVMDVYFKKSPKIVSQAA